MSSASSAREAYERAKHNASQTPPRPTPETSRLSVPCRKCQTVNDDSRRFCTGCGAKLWKPCLKCGVECGANERFCGACGIDLQRIEDELIHQYHAVVEEAKRLQKQLQFRESLLKLRSLPPNEHPCLDEFWPTVRPLIDRFEAERDQVNAKIEKLVNRARKARELGRYDKAIEAIEAIPMALRSDDLATMLNDSKRKQKTVELLKESFDQVDESTDLAEAADSIGELMTITPGDPQIQIWGKQIASKIKAAARELIGKHQYREATGLLERIPEATRTKESDALLDETTELACLEEYIKRAPYADKALESMIQRLKQTVPQHPLLAKVEPVLQQRMSAASNGSLQPWSKSPHATPWKCPVDLQPPLRKFVPDEACQDAWRAGNTQWTTACGLALQGLGEVAMPTNLRPPAKSGVLGLLKGRKASNVAWGIDPGASGLRVVCLEDMGDHCRVKACKHYAIAPLEADDEAKQYTTRLARVTAAMGRDFPELEKAKVVLGWSAIDTLTRVFSMPQADAKKKKQLLEYEISHQIPFDRSHMLVDTFEIPVQDDKHARNVVLIATRRSEAEQRIELFQSLGIGVDILQVDAFAIHNVVRYEGWLDDRTEGTSLLLVDVGQESTNIILSTKEAAWFRAVRFGGQDLTRALAVKFRLTTEQANQVCREPHRARRISTLLQVLQPKFNRLATEIHISLDSFDKALGQSRLVHMYGCGGTMKQPGLLAALRHGANPATVSQLHS